jgi:lipopolysaccharide/colanic/teichoic acid biosynthesis glycosyltransferase
MTSTFTRLAMRVFGALGLILLTPTILVIALVILAIDGRPVLVHEDWVDLLVKGDCGWEALK